MCRQETTENPDQFMPKMESLIEDYDSRTVTAEENSEAIRDVFTSGLQSSIRQCLLENLSLYL